MNFKKKAIEPIVATILLVVVAVILVTIVLAWGKNFTTGGLNEANNLTNDSCSNATIAITSCDWTATTGPVVFTIKNTSDTYTFAANDFNANVFDSTTLTEADLENTITVEELIPGESRVATATISGVNANSVKLNVRSLTCPNIAVSEITCN